MMKNRKNAASRLIGYDLPAAFAQGCVFADQVWLSLYDPDASSQATILHVHMRTRLGVLKRKIAELFPDITGPSNYTVEDFIRFAALFPEYCCRLYTRRLPAKVFSIAEECNAEGLKLVNISQQDDGFMFFIPSRSTINAVVCVQCFKTYKRHSRHVCRKKCLKCRGVNCTGADIPSIKCPECHHLFHRQECFDRHKQRTVGYRQSICQQVRFCPKCHATYNVASRAQHGGHQCGSIRFCLNCEDYRPNTHNCSWKSPTTAQIAKKKKVQETFRIIFYDFETVIATREGLFAHEDHWVNVACFEIVCNNCYREHQDYSCASCGPVRRGTFPYESADDRSVASRFLYFLLHHKPLNNSIAIAHNGGKYDVHFLIHLLLLEPVELHPISNGEKIIQLSVKSTTLNSITFKDSLLFIPFPLSKMPEAFGFENLTKGDFPFLFNHPENYGSVLDHLPDRRFYNPERRQPEALKKFNVWYEEHRTNPFDFDREIVQYCENDVKLLLKGVCAYIKICLEITGFNPVVHCATYASFSFFQLRHSHMSDFKVGVIPENGFHGNDKQSKLALTYIKWLEQEEDKQFQYYLNIGEFQVPGTNFKVDAYHGPTNTIIEVLGCYYHGCKKHTRPTDLNHGRCMGDVYKATMERLQLIETLGFNVEHIWECDIWSMCKLDCRMAKFFKNAHHFRRLQIRDAFFGARTQNFVLEADAVENETIEHLDVVSMYPAVLCREKMPQGQPVVVTENIATISLPLPYRGFYLLDILPPRGLRHAVLPMKYDQKVIFTLCRSCVTSRTIFCTHDDDERFLHTTVYQAELEKALEKGYVVLKCYEVWHWPEAVWSDNLFKDFLMKWFKIKLESSGYPRSDMTNQEKDDYIDHVQQVEGIKLDKEKICKNTPLRTVAKLAINSSWGKFGEKSNKNQLMFGQDDQDWLNLVNDPRLEILRVEDIGPVNLTTYRTQAEFVKPRRGTSVVIAAITTCMGRLMLYEALDRLQERALYCDTDSVIMVNLPGADNLEELRGTTLGRWMSEVADGWRVRSYVGAGPKVYGYVKEQISTGLQVQHMKIRGITQNAESSATMNLDALKVIVKDMLENNGAADGPVIHDQRIGRKRGHVFNVSGPKRLRTVMDKLGLHENNTLPFGYF